MFISHYSGLVALQRKGCPFQIENVPFAIVSSMASVYILLTLSDHNSVFPKGRETYLTYPIGYFRPLALISTENSYKIDCSLPSPFVDNCLASSANLFIQNEVFHLWADFSRLIKWQPNSISSS